MKQIFLFSFFLIAVTIANAQIKKAEAPVMSNKAATILKNAPIAPAATQSPTATQSPSSATPAGTSGSQQKATVTNASASPAPVKTDADYYLSAVSVTIKTGRDNKEYPSAISLDVAPGNITGYYQLGMRCFTLSNYKNELKVNNPAELYIPKRSSNYPYEATENTLAKYKQNGLAFRIIYFPNLAVDAWKVEGISLTLQFKDANGNSHPTLGNKVITFTDASLWMDGFDKVVTLYKTDGSFNPMPVWQGSVNTYKATYKN